MSTDDESVRREDTSRLPALDALRAVGAIAVVATHVGFWTAATSDPFWGGLVARLNVGVAIFFVLSGFLLFRPFAQSAATRTTAADTYRPDATGRADPAGVLDRDDRVPLVLPQTRP